MYKLLSILILAASLSAFVANKPVTYKQDAPLVIEARPTRESLLTAVNNERAKYGVQPLKEDVRLDESAQTKACDEYNNHYFGHVNPSGVHGVSIARDNLKLAGVYSENITQPTPVTTNQAITNWINSKPHHDAMIKAEYTVTGFGICGNQLVEHFYRPL